MSDIDITIESRPRPPRSPTTDPAEVLAEMAETFRDRNDVYGDNWLGVGRVLHALHPEGLRMENARDFEIGHLYLLVIVKLTRFSNSLCTHKDSIHDLAVYAAMIEAALAREEVAE